ncbi:MAG: hypothetical protein EKK41_01925 [Hyphomicrobiales bacterium]|nr:MAG: hypothetical protein EKK41_01925 [Hyphomicrobiales bacterium]
MTSTSSEPSASQSRAPASLGWAMRRAALGFLAMMAVVMLSAWLLYSSIDPDEAAAAGLPPASQSEPSE